MELTLNQELQRFINEQVQSGRYASASEVVEAALARLMIDDPEDELDEQDIAAIRESEKQIARGQVYDFKEVAAELRAKYLGK